MELLTNDWNVLTKKILKAVETAYRFFLAQVTSRKTAGLMALRASRLKAAENIHPSLTTSRKTAGLTAPGA